LRTHRRRTGHVVAARDRVLVDSGAWIALVRLGDQYHSEADRLFRRASALRIPLVTTNLIIAEVHRFILFHVGVRAAALLLERIDASQLLTTEFQDRRAPRLGPQVDREALGPGHLLYRCGQFRGHGGDPVHGRDELRSGLRHRRVPTLATDGRGVSRPAILSPIGRHRRLIATR
jgi:hypothetical protein